MRTATFAALSLTALALLTANAQAAPKITRLNPPSRLFSEGTQFGPVTARFLPDQRFDLQATVAPDAGQKITKVEFIADDQHVYAATSLTPADAKGLAEASISASYRAFSETKPGVHNFSVVATQTDGKTTTATGCYEIMPVQKGKKKAKNVIILIGDGMGIAHRTAARLMLRGSIQGKATAPLAMDTFPFTGLVMTASLNSIVTDSAPGAHCYSTGNKADNNEEGVFPDDTTADFFDNPRIENMAEYLHRKVGKSLGVVTTADVFDATPAAFGIHTSNRGAGTGIIDQFLAERDKSGLTVLMGGGRKWFLPAGVAGSQRSDKNDYVLPDDVMAKWGVPKGAKDPATDALAEWQKAGFTYAPDRTALDKIPADATKLLGLFAFSNMNVSKDKIDGRRGASTVVKDYGFPDQPMLDEMATKALEVLSKNKDGFVLMVEGASIDKQSHTMDGERLILDTIEFDRAIAVCKAFAEKNPDTLVIVTADHECSGFNILGASKVTNDDLKKRAASGGGAKELRDPVVGVYEEAGFPRYQIAADGYPVTTDIDHKLILGFAANADRYEDWLTNPLPLQDSQQPLVKEAPLSTYPSGPLFRDTAGMFLITGQIPGAVAVHTGSDIPLSAFGRGSSLFTGVMDNTDVFFKALQIVLGGEK